MAKRSKVKRVGGYKKWRQYCNEMSPVWAILFVAALPLVYPWIVLSWFTCLLPKKWETRANERLEFWAYDAPELGMLCTIILTVWIVTIVIALKHTIFSAG